MAISNLTYGAVNVSSLCSLIFSLARFVCLASAYLADFTKRFIFALAFVSFYLGAIQGV